MRILILIFLISLNLEVGAQSLLSQFFKLRCPEKWWVITHLFVAKKAFLLTQEARAATSEIVRDSILDNRFNGGKADAFRHSYWMALLAQQMKVKKAYKLGIAHEKANYIDFKKGKMEDGVLPDSMSCVMDLYNNSVGLATGEQYKNLSREELKGFIIEKVKYGRMKVLKCDSFGNSLDCNNQIIKIPETKTWSLPKCLINSNEK